MNILVSVVWEGADISGLPTEIFLSFPKFRLKYVNFEHVILKSEGQNKKVLYLIFNQWRCIGGLDVKIRALF
jgi:hypothetical protein